MRDAIQKQSIVRTIILVAILAGLAGFIGIRKYLAYAEIQQARFIAEHGFPVGPSFEYPPDRADKVQILDLLKARKFEKLTALLDGYQKDFVRDFRTEYTVFDAFDAFSTQGPLIEPYLDEWVSQMPDSYCPYLARGCHYKGRGWADRGTGIASETSSEQFAGMQFYFEKAQKDLDIALKLNPNLLNAYVFSSDISSATSTGKTPEQWFREGEKHMPYSLMLRISYLGRLSPRWGGSYREMASFADESDRLISHNPNFRVLGGYVEFDRGSLLCASGKDAAAVEYFTKALKHGEFYLYLEYRARCLGNLGKEREALLDLDRAVKLRPQRIDILLSRADRLVELKKYHEARETLSLVSRLDPESKDYLDKRGYLVGRMDYHSYQLFVSHHLEEALKILDEAEQVDPSNWGPYYYKAGIFYEQHEVDSAFANINKAIELAGDSFDPYTTRNHFLADQRKWDEIIKHMDEYIAIRPGNGQAYLERGWARKFKNELDAARADFEKACELGNNNACKEIGPTPKT